MNKLQRVFLSFLLLSIFNSIVHCKKEAPPTPDVDDGDDGETNNICKDGQCYCDNIEPYLISCVGNSLDASYDIDEWNHTVQFNKISDKNLDVRMDNNRITEIPKFPKMKIVNLSFKNNLIQHIDENAFAELDDLLSLDLSQNRLTSNSLPEPVFQGRINETFYKPIGLQHLNLSYNLIHSIEKDVFDHLPYLITLDLSNNPLKVIGGSTGMAIASLRNLQSLTMANAQLKNIPEALFHDLINLKYLDLSGNKFTTVPHEIRNTHELKALFLDNNLFESLNHESFEGLSYLQLLSISYIPTLKFIEGHAFSSLENLTVFKCHHNRQLTKISNDAFRDLADSEEWPIKEIWLNDNGLSHIDRELAAWEMVQYIDIQNNPFRCNCDLKWMTQVLVSQIARSNPYLAMSIKCSEPENLRGADLLELSIEDGRFSKCKPGESARQLAGSEMEDPMPTYHALSMTILIIGIILTLTGLTILGIIVIKRRAIAAALIAHHQIRYQRADTYDDDTYRSPSSNTAYKVVV